jgi:hypothetical protein
MLRTVCRCRIFFIFQKISKKKTKKFLNRSLSLPDTVAMEKVVDACQAGKKIVELCQLGDDTIMAELTRLYGKKGKIDKGVGFPTCVSANACAGHFSPLSADTTTLANGDVVKIDLGVHVDGFLALSARTIVINPPAEGISGKTADVIAAAHHAIAAAMRMIRPGTKVSPCTRKREGKGGPRSFPFFPTTFFLGILWFSMAHQPAMRNQYFRTAFPRLRRHRVFKDPRTHFLTACET